MDAYEKSVFPELISLLSEPEVGAKFIAMAPSLNEKDFSKINAAGEKLHRHLKSQFPSIENQTK